MNFETLKRMAPWEWPENAGEIFLQVARNQDNSEEDRLLALELAGDCTVIDDSIALGLIQILEDRQEAERTRAKAASALGAVLEYSEILDYREKDMSISLAIFDRIQNILKALHESMEVPKLVRRRCLEASVRAPGDWHAGAVWTAYDSGDPEEKLTAVFCMGYLDGFQEELNRALGDEDPAIRKEAAEALGNFQGENPWFDVDDPLDASLAGASGVNDVLKFPGTGATTPFGRDFSWTPPPKTTLKTSDEVLDELLKTLSREEVPWDDGLPEDDGEDDPEL